MIMLSSCFHACKCCLKFPLKGSIYINQIRPLLRHARERVFCLIISYSVVGVVIFWLLDRYLYQFTLYFFVDGPLQILST